MTVKQLKTALEHYPENALVFVEGYEGGYADIGTIKETRVELDKNKKSYMGPHEESATSKDVAIVFIKAQNPIAED